MTKILVIIPAYNERESILQVIKSLKELPLPLDYVVVNDCSKDDTKEIL